jgi:hypothetical protein
MWTTTMTSVARMSDRIRLLNDHLRTTFVGGKIMLTAGVDALSDEAKAMVLSKVRTFAYFNGDNDPHGEHDFGSFKLEGVTYFFKLDYYSPDMEAGSEDPADPEKTTRVLTIMRADEYRSSTNRKEASDGHSATCISRVHGREARRPRRLLARDWRRVLPSIG